MIYLACPYAHDDSAIREYRLVTVTEAAQEMISGGLRVISPLTYTCRFDSPPPDGWYEFGLELLRRCDMLVVYALPGWSASEGVRLELKEAKRLQLPISFLANQLEVAEFTQRQTSGPFWTGLARAMTPDAVR